jgi:uncharacterized protein (DUF433 family)
MRMYAEPMSGQELDERATFSLPLYTRAQAARIIGVSPNTFNNWAKGYTYKRAGAPVRQSPIVTTTDEFFGLSVPFDGIAEAYVLTRLHELGVPMQRIRPAVRTLQAEQGLEHALLSERLKTDGAVVLFDYLLQMDPEFDPAPQLTEVVSKQAVFEESVNQYLHTIAYSSERVAAFDLPQYPFPVSVNPHVNGGQPTLSEFGVRVSDITSRVRAGEAIADVAEDYEVPLDQVRSLVDA